MTEDSYDKLYYCSACRTLSQQDGVCSDCSTQLIFAGTPVMREQIRDTERGANFRRRLRWEGISAVLIGGPGIALTFWLLWQLPRSAPKWAPPHWLESAIAELGSWLLMGVILFWIVAGGVFGGIASRWFRRGKPKDIEEAFRRLRKNE